MKWYQRLFNWIVLTFFPRTVKRLDETAVLKHRERNMTEWEKEKMKSLPKECVNPTTGERFFAYGCDFNEDTKSPWEGGLTYADSGEDKDRHTRNH